MTRLRRKKSQFLCDCRVVMRSDQLQSTRHGSTCVAVLGPEYHSLDDDVLGEVEQFLFRCADPEETKNLVIDLSATTYFGSLFIEVLFRAYSRIKRKGGRFALSGLRGHVVEVIYISKLQQLWEIFDTADEAVRDMNRSDAQGK